MPSQRLPDPAERALRAAPAPATEHSAYLPDGLWRAGPAALARRIESLALGLAAHGLRAEDQVLIAPQPGMDWLAVILAVARCGARAVPLAADLTIARRAEIAQTARARLGLTGADAAPLPGVRQNLTLGDIAGPAPDASLPPAPRADDGAVVLHDATGSGIVFGHGALIAAAQGLVARYRLVASDRVLPVAPAGGAEWLTWALAAACAGAELLDAPETDPEDWYDAIVALRPTILAIPDPRQMLGLVQDDAFDTRDFAALRYLRATGPADMLHRLTGDFPGAALIHAYAPRLMAGLPVCSDPRDPVLTGATTAGRPLRGVEVMIVDPATGKDMLLYEIGEIWLRGAQVFSGFLHHPAEAAGVLQADGFLRSGDLGYLDREGRVVLA